MNPYSEIKPANLKPRNPFFRCIPVIPFLLPGFPIGFRGSLICPLAHIRPMRVFPRLPILANRVRSSPRLFLLNLDKIERNYRLRGQGGSGQEKCAPYRN